MTTSSFQIDYYQVDCLHIYNKNRVNQVVIRLAGSYPEYDKYLALYPDTEIELDGAKIDERQLIHWFTNEDGPVNVEITRDQNKYMMIVKAIFTRKGR